MKLYVYHRLSDEQRAQLAAAGESFPVYVVNSYEPPFPLSLIQHASLDSDGEAARLNLTGAALPPTALPQLPSHTLYAATVRRAHLNSLARYPTYAIGSMDVKLVAGKNPSIEEIIAAVSDQATLTPEQELHNRVAEQQQITWRREEDERESKRKADIQARERDAHTRMNNLRTWALLNGSALLKARIEDGYDWDALGEQEWFTAHSPEGYDSELYDDCDNWKENARTTPTLQEIEEARAARMLNPTARLLWYYRTWDYNEDCIRPAEKGCAIEITLFAPTGRSKEVYKVLGKDTKEDE